jgi:hypothetical protein
VSDMPSFPEGAYAVVISAPFASWIWAHHFRAVSSQGCSRAIYSGGAHAHASFNLPWLWRSIESPAVQPEMAIAALCWPFCTWRSSCSGWYARGWRFDFSSGPRHVRKKQRAVIMSFKIPIDISVRPRTEQRCMQVRQWEPTPVCWPSFALSI